MTRTEALPEDLRSRAETAARLNISTVTLDIWRKARIGPIPVQRGRRVLYHVASVEKFIIERSKRAVMGNAGDGMASIIQDELSEIFGAHETLAVDDIAVVAECVRKLDISVRGGHSGEDAPRMLVRGARTLLRTLYLLAGTVSIEDTLAREIAIGAIRTVSDLFPQLIPELYAP